MSIKMIVLLGVFVWAPLMGFLLWKFVQTFSFFRKSRAVKRRTRHALLLAGEGHMIHNEERRRVRRSF